MRESSPSADDVAGLLLRMIDGAWPSTEVERRDFYHRLGLTQLPWDSSVGERDEHSGADWHRFATALPGVDGIDTVFGQEFLGLSLFAFNEPGDDGPASRAAYPVIKDLLSARIGEPVEEWGTSREPACLWLIEPLHVEMYCFQRRASGLMVGPGHIARSAAYDRVAEMNSARPNQP